MGALLLAFIESFSRANARALGGAAQVRPLGVERARPFYARCGYRHEEEEGQGGAPPSSSKYRRKEMVKELPLLLLPGCSSAAAAPAG